jgi:hypothetical protein
MGCTCWATYQDYVPEKNATWAADKSTGQIQTLFHGGMVVLYRFDNANRGV